MKLFFLPLTVLLIWGVTPLDAGLIYTDFTGSGTYPGGWAIAGSTSIYEEYQAIAASFQPTATENLASIDLALEWDAGRDSVMVDLASDDSGAPGAVIESMIISGIPGSPVTVETADSVLNPLLTAGTTYWVEVLPGGSDTAAGWFYDSTDYSGLDGNHGSGWNSGDDTTPSFDVNGVGGATPEPSTVILLTCALAGLGLFARRLAAMRVS